MIIGVNIDKFIEAQNRGYLCFDLEDYLVNDIIGPNNEEVPCDVWEDMKSTSLASWQATQKALSEYFIKASASQDQTTEECLQEPVRSRMNEAVLRFWNECHTEFSVIFETFWNTQICTPLTGVSTITTAWSDLDGNSGTNTPAIDYGSGVLTEEIWENYLKGTEDYMCCMRQTISIIDGTDFEQKPDLSEFPHEQVDKYVFSNP